MRKKFLIVSTILLLIGVMILFIFAYYKKQVQNQVRKENQLIEDIESHYHSSVSIVKNAPIYKKENKKYIKVGIGFKDVELMLEGITNNSKQKYFKIEKSDYYIYYKNVEKVSKPLKKDNRYHNYLYFNESLKTKDTFSLYNKSQKEYTFYESMDFKILIKEENKYGVVYHDNLYYINEQDVSSIYSSDNNEKEVASEIPVTVYHFLYLKNESCNEIICNSINQVEEEFNYLKENKYFTLNTKEMELFIKGKINLPKNSILITIDDGAKATNFLDVLDKYQINATLFLVSSWYPKEDFKSNYLELASHTHNLHNPGVCSEGQGSPLKCSNKNELLSDLKESRKTLNNTDSFCFPFYEYNDYAIEIVKEAGFKTAYIGGNRKASIGINPYTIPRITIHNNISLEQYINFIQ
ncbi:MAG: polysaccharide deacetylase family protein [Bacilli bacterium]|nr:polysaccharide deacetylase family protein [Bacilli bacterium]